MKKTLSASALKHEAFVLALLSGMTAADAARKAGYGRKDANARIVAWELLQREDIQRRLVELSEAATDEAVLSILARRQILSEIARARMCDYQDEHGVIRPLDGDAPNPVAIESVEYRWDPIKKESYPWRIKLRDPVDAIVELCKLDGSYKDKKVEASLPAITTVTVDQARTKVSAKVEAVGVETEDGHEGGASPKGKGKQGKTSR